MNSDVVRSYLAVKSLGVPFSHVVLSNDGSENHKDIDRVAREWFISFSSRATSINEFIGSVTIDSFVHTAFLYALLMNELYKTDDATLLKDINEYFIDNDVATVDSIETLSREWIASVEVSYASDINISEWLEFLSTSLFDEEMNDRVEVTFTYSDSTSLLIDATKGDLISLFDSVAASPSIPLLVVVGDSTDEVCYKAYTMTSDLTKISYLLKDANSNRLSLCMCVDTKVYVTASISESLTISVERLSNKSTSLSSSSNTVSDILALNGIQTGEWKHSNIGGYFALPCHGFSIESFIYFVMTDQVASSFVRLNDATSPFSLRPLIEADGFPRIQFKVCTLNDILVERWSAVFTMSLVTPPTPLNIDTVRITFRKADDEIAVDDVVEVLCRVLRLYEKKTSRLNEYLSNVTTPKRNSSSHTTVNENASQLMKLMDLAPDLFRSRYGTGCMTARQPQIYVLTGDKKVDDEEVSKIKDFEFLVGTTKIPREVMYFPTSNPRYVFYSNNAEFPFPGTQQNQRLDNKDIYPLVPCLFRYRQKSEIKDSQKGLVMGRKAIIDSSFKQISSLRVFKTDRIMPPGRLAYVSGALTSLVDLEKTTLCRYGVIKSPSSLIHCMFVACNDEAYSKSTNETKERLVALKRAKLSALLKTEGRDIVSKELYDINFSDILDELNDSSVFLDPFIFFRLIELHWKVNLFVFVNRDDSSSFDKINFEVPRHDLFHQRMYDSSLPTVLIFKHCGSKFDRQVSVNHMQCELIVACKLKGCGNSQSVNKRDIVSRCFNGSKVYEAFGSVHRHYIFNADECNVSTKVIVKKEKKIVPTNHVRKTRLVLMSLLYVVEWLFLIWNNENTEEGSDCVATFSSLVFRLIDGKGDVDDIPYNLDFLSSMLPSIVDLSDALLFLHQNIPSLVSSIEGGLYVTFYCQVLMNRVIAHLKSFYQSGCGKTFSTPLRLNLLMPCKNNTLFRSFDTLQGWIERPSQQKASFLTRLDGVESAIKEPFVLKTQDGACWLVQNPPCTRSNSYRESIYIAKTMRDYSYNDRLLSEWIDDDRSNEEVLIYTMLSNGSVVTDGYKFTKPIHLLHYGADVYAALLPLNEINKNN